MNGLFVDKVQISCLFDVAQSTQPLRFSLLDTRPVQCSNARRAVVAQVIHLFDHSRSRLLHHLAAICRRAALPTVCSDKGGKVSPTSLSDMGGFSRRLRALLVGVPVDGGAVELSEEELLVVGLTPAALTTLQFRRSILRS